ncbi:erythromycin esterase family protein [Sphaerisporangium fuscum]|uniref:erythromycin esterase family protein n=1 Tax=Sphaerisporangium fuscum TaxID=2835868 RepID=UPI001BDD9F22|nr:erythromycin esterase family protein [Sphaerisporangium fuscum]
MSECLFRDRRDAGRALAALLDHYRGRDDVVVLALPRGGVPIGYEVAKALGAPLDVQVVRNLGVPGQEDLAMGAVAADGAIALNDDVVRGLAIPPEVVEHVADWEGREILHWERRYRPDGPGRPVEGKVAILVDDGLSTGAAIRAAVKAVRRRHPARVVIALPAAPEPTCEEMESEVDEVVSATTPSAYFAVDPSYWDYTEVTVDDVRDLLTASATSMPAKAIGLPQAEVAALRAEVMPADDGLPTPEALSDLVGDARLVLIGGASHGTHEFYEARAAMTRQLIEEKGFQAVAVQADWPDAYRVNRYVQGYGEDVTAEEALRGFQRFPAWMWRNTVVLDFVSWLREHNDRLPGPDAGKAGFYGLDLYGAHRAMREVITCLERADLTAAACAREHYACFDHLGGEVETHGVKPACGVGEACEGEIVERLVGLLRHAVEDARKEGLLPEDELFYAQLNARALKKAREHYRSMFCGRIASWNMRDRHMADTLDALADHLGGPGGPAKMVVWAHNAHVGDSRATEAACRGEVDLGGLVRERHEAVCRLIGFTTCTGTVTAAHHWEGTAERKWLRPAMPGSVEELFHEVEVKAFFVPFQGAPRTADILRSARLERLVGAVYRPESERRSHYFRARLRDQFDAVVHIDETRALEPLDPGDRWLRGEIPETSPVAH